MPVRNRHELALCYLDGSEQSAFTRAFKRWSGKAPSAYRAEPGRKMASYLGATLGAGRLIGLSVRGLR